MQMVSAVYTTIALTNVPINDHRRSDFVDWTLIYIQSIILLIINF